MNQEEQGIVHWEFETEQESPTIDVAHVIANLEEKDSNDLSPIYDTIDHVIDNIFADPPSPDAQIEISFTYEGYRITINQDGSATFLKIV